MKHNSDIRALAQEYILDKPAGWFTISSFASSETARKVAISFSDRLKLNNISDEIAPVIEDSLLSWFLAPDTAKILCVLDNEKAAKDWLCTEVSDHLPRLQLSVWNTENDSNFDIVDLVDGIHGHWPIRRFFDYKEYYDSPRIMSVFRPTEIDIAQLPIRDYLSRALNSKRDAPCQVQTASKTRLVRFHAIDRALYDATPQTSRIE